MSEIEEMRACQRGDCVLYDDNCPDPGGKSRSTKQEVMRHIHGQEHDCSEQPELYGNAKILIGGWHCCRPLWVSFLATERIPALDSCPALCRGIAAMFRCRVAFCNLGYLSLTCSKGLRQTPVIKLRRRTYRVRGRDRPDLNAQSVCCRRWLEKMASETR